MGRQEYIKCKQCSHDIPISYIVIDTSDVEHCPLCGGVDFGPVELKIEPDLASWYAQREANKGPYCLQLLSSHKLKCRKGYPCIIFNT